MNTIWLFSIILVLSTTPEALGEEDTKHMKFGGRLVVDFALPQEERWRVVNDGVMGGKSQSQLRFSENGTAVFAGVVSLENNGGFASVRASLEGFDLSAYDGLAVRVFGDGKTYRVRLRTDDRFDGIAYQASFDTSKDEWLVIEIPFTAFVPTYRGRTLPDASRLNTTKISQIGFMIADKQKGEFRLEISAVRAWKNSTRERLDR